MRFFYAIAILLLAGYSHSFSQGIPVRGKVKCEIDSLCQGITVNVKGTSNTTVTDKNGEFIISVSKLPTTLVFSGLGYITKQVVLKKTDSLKFVRVKLEVETASLEEVVVIGYGTQKKKEITSGAIVSRSSLSYSSPAGEKKSVGINSGIPEKAANSKILTAGELSDFKKWKLWEGYTKDQFRQWSEHWGISPTNRYCVQVQNEERKGIAGEKVYLLNEAKDTVWRSVTDNTGKAELWGNLVTTETKQSSYTIICGDKTLLHPAAFENGINRITLNKNCDHSNITDIAFVVDATGSMGDEISYLQGELEDVIARVSNENKGIDLRLASVFYRDHTDSYLTRSIDFQKDPASLLKFINSQWAAGGGDFPEAVDAALSVALDSLQWDASARAKILFLMLDAPPHDRARERMKTLMVRAATMGVRIVPVVCSGIDKSTEYLMRSLALATNGSYVFLTDDSGVGQAHIKPTTDNFKVELLNQVLQRLITEMTYLPACNESDKIVGPAFRDNNIAKLVVYPNPSQGRIQIKATHKIQELYVADFAGKLLQKIQVSDKVRSWSADLGNYPSGAYLIRYFSEEKGWGAEKVLLVK